MAKTTVVGTFNINGKAREVRRNGNNYFYTEDTGNSSRKVDLTPTQIRMLEKDFINFTPISFRDLVAQNNGLTPITNTTTSSNNSNSSKTLVGSYNTGHSTVKAYTDGKGNYFYENGNKEQKITDTSKITFSSGTSSNTTNNSSSQNNGLLGGILGGIGAGLLNSTNTNNGSSVQNSGQSVGTYDVPNYSVDSNVSVGPVSAPLPKLMTAAELAELYGFNYDYDYILNMLNEGTDMYLNEMTEKAKKLQGDSLRNQSALYQQYLDTLRATRANAVNTGINRGALAAQELSQYLLAQQQIGTSQSDFNSKMYDLYNEAITERARNKETARQQYNQLGNALMSAAANLNANDVQRYAADLGAAAQIAAANASANAATKQAAIQAQNNSYINWLNSYSNPQNAWLAELYKQNMNATNNQMNAQTKYYNKQASE